jgi:hypothetical protein
VFLLLRTGDVNFRFADTGQDLLCGGEIGEGLTSSPPALAAIHLNEQSGIQRDVGSVDAARGVQQAVGANHASPGITQDRELAVHHFFPDGASVLVIVNADRQHPRVEGIEIFFVPRELAQLARTVGSPIPAIEKQEHALPV